MASTETCVRSSAVLLNHQRVPVIDAIAVSDCDGKAKLNEIFAKYRDRLHRPGPDQRGGPTGRGDAWVRIGPIKLFLDGGMLNGSAYMRQPWPRGDPYQIVEDDYRGLLFIKPDQLQLVLEEAAKRGWRMTAH